MAKHGGGQSRRTGRRSTRSTSNPTGRGRSGAIKDALKKAGVLGKGAKGITSY